MTGDATTSLPGPRMDATLCSNPRAQAASNSGPCSPMAAIQNNSPPAGATPSPTGAGSDLLYFGPGPHFEVLKNFGNCHSERSEESAICRAPEKTIFNTKFGFYLEDAVKHVSRFI